MPLLAGPSYPANAAAAALAVAFKVYKQQHLSWDPRKASQLGARELLVKLRDRREPADDDRFHKSEAVASFLGLCVESWQPSQLATIALASLEEALVAAEAGAAAAVTRKRHAEAPQQKAAKVTRRR